MDFETNQETFSSSNHEETLGLSHLMIPYHYQFTKKKKKDRNQIKFENFENAYETLWEWNELNQGEKRNRKSPVKHLFTTENKWHPRSSSNRLILKPNGSLTPQIISLKTNTEWDRVKMKTQGFIWWGTKYKDQATMESWHKSSFSFFFFFLLLCVLLQQDSDKAEVRKDPFVKIHKRLGRKAECKTQERAQNAGLVTIPQVWRHSNVYIFSLLKYQHAHTLPRIKPRRKWHILKPFSTATFLITLRHLKSN